MLDCIGAIGRFTSGKSEDDFLDSELLQAGVIHELEILGEAAKNISEEFRATHLEVPWKKITGTRDKLTHEYFGIDLELTWKIVKEDIPPLKKQLEEIKNALSK